MSFDLRRLVPTDVDDVVALSLRAWAPVFASFEQVLGSGVYRRLWPAWQVSQAADVRAVCLSGDAEVWVADVEGRPVGFVAVRPGQEPNAGEIEMIAVDPGNQRQGIGAALLAKGVDHMRSIGCTLAEIGTGGDPGHAPARRAYARAGFTALPQVRYYKIL